MTRRLVGSPVSVLSIQRLLEMDVSLLFSEAFVNKIITLLSN
jgi:hypothetical protein